MTRSNARELAVHLIYSRSFTGEEPEAALEARLDRAYYAALSGENEVYTERPSRKQLAYLDQVVVGTANRAEELDAIIGRYSIGWDVKRISRLTRAILQLALFECRYVEDVPVGVAVNEAVELSKKFGGDGSPAFVNGVLGKIGKMEKAEIEKAAEAEAEKEEKTAEAEMETEKAETEAAE